MGALLSAKDLKKIQTVLGVEPKRSKGLVRFEIAAEQSTRSLALEIHDDVKIGARKGPLVTVYTPSSHLQLHFCTGYVASEFLGEVTFVGESQGILSGLTIEREGGCSLYANVDRSVLSGDFSKLGPEVMLSGVALSLVEDVLPAAPATQRTRRAGKRKVTKRA